MKIYAVGGAIRDTLMGLPMHDIDYVVVGSSVDEMLAKGFSPVGKDFPVFLHPESHAEYALARTCLLYTSPSPRDGLLSRMPSSA